jgi:protein-disulfide isomerase
MKRMMKPTINTAVLVASMVLAWAAAQAADGSSFKPPAGARVAVVVFEDLQCPSCAQAYPAVWDAANAHHIPVVLHDFPLTKHNWSFQAAVFARFFDTLKLGNAYRGYIYKNQSLIPDEGGLNNYTKKFADENKIHLPSAVDPAGKLTEKVKADFDLGMKIGLQYTPTIFVVGQDSANAVTPFVEVEDRNQLSQIIADMLKKAPAPPVKTPVKTTTAASKKKAG